MLVYINTNMFKKCNYKKWIFVGLLIVLVFFLLKSFRSIYMLEGFDSKNYINCSDISNCTDCHDYGTSEDGKCAWCTKKNACVLREPPDKDDPNYVQKYKDFVYFDTHQDDGECSSDKMNCSKKAESGGGGGVGGPKSGPEGRVAARKQ